MNKKDYFSYPAIILICLLLNACGGGGGNATNATVGINSNNQPQPNIPPDASGIETRVITQPGEVVQFNLDGALDEDGQIVRYRWYQQYGPDAAVELTGEHYTLVAPDLEDSSFVELIYSLTIEDNDYATDSTRIYIYIVPEPVVSAGEDETFNGGSTVNLAGAVQNLDLWVETSGMSEWVEYYWVQTAGPEVPITNADSASMTFPAPATDTPIFLEFELTATNYFGVSSSDTVEVEIVHPAAPDLNLEFPPPAGAFTGTDIDVFGTAMSGCEVVIQPDGNWYCGPPKAIQSVTVDAGLGTVNAALNNSVWRVENLEIPTDVPEVTITVTAEDAVGRVRMAKAVLKKDDASVGAGDPLDEPVAVATSNFGHYGRIERATGPDFDTVFILTKNTSDGAVKLIPVDVDSGNRGNTMIDFSDDRLVPMLTEPGHMLYRNQEFYISSKSPAVTGVITFNQYLLQRSLISGEGVGNGPAFESPHGLAFGPDNSLLVADTEANTVFSVNMSTGDRIPLADQNSGGSGIESPLYVSWGEADAVSVSGHIPVDPYLYSINLATDPISGTSLSQNSTNNGPDLAPESQGILSGGYGTLFVLNGGDDNILAVDSNGDTSLIADDVTGSETSFSPLTNRKAFTSTGARGYHVLYVVGGDGISGRYTLYAIDPASGDKVVVSR